MDTWKSDLLVSVKGFGINTTSRSSHELVEVAHASTLLKMAQPICNRFKM
jgi:hypothetical protein